MNVWVRISARMDVDTDLDGSVATNVQIKAGLNLSVYAARDRAKAAQQKAGGIILEVDAACLANVESEFGNEVSLTPDASEGKQTQVTYINFCYDGLPWKSVPNYGPHEPGTVEPQGDIAEFGPEAEAWLRELADQTGFEFHQ